MRMFSMGALLCLLAVQASAQSPLTYQVIAARARSSPEQWRAETLLAERQFQLQESRGFLREGPMIAILAGPRRLAGVGTRTDKSLEVDLPLFLDLTTRAALEVSLGKAHPLLLEAARREGLLRLKRAYLDTWIAFRMVELREADLATVGRWLGVARARLESGADPAFQVSLVEGERLKAQQELEEARIQSVQAWGTLVTMADLPLSPVPLAGPDPVPEVPREDLERFLLSSPMRKALVAQVDLEVQSLRLKESLALSRWSLRGSYAQEGEDSVARFGIALRLPRLGEGASIRRATEAQIRSVRGEAQQALMVFDARMASLLAHLTASEGGEATPDFSGALEAIRLRLEEGRDRPSDALPIRRQLLEAQMASLRRVHLRQVLFAEFQTLLLEVNP